MGDLSGKSAGPRRPPQADPTAAMIRELDKAATDRELRASRGRKAGFLTLDDEPQGTTMPQGGKPLLGL